MIQAHQLDSEPANPVTVQLDLFNRPRQTMALADHAGQATAEPLIDVEAIRLQASIRRAIENGQIEMMREENEEMYTIDSDKLAEVCKLANVTEQKALEYIDYDWSNGAEHQEWLDTAPADEIAHWVVDCVQAYGVQQRQIQR